MPVWESIFPSASVILAQTVSHWVPRHTKPVQSHLTVDLKHPILPINLSRQGMVPCIASAPGRGLARAKQTSGDDTNRSQERFQSTSTYSAFVICPKSVFVWVSEPHIHRRASARCLLIFLNLSQVLTASTSDVPYEGLWFVTAHITTLSLERQPCQNFQITSEGTEESIWAPVSMTMAAEKEHAGDGQLTPSFNGSSNVTNGDVTTPNESNAEEGIRKHEKPKDEAPPRDIHGWKWSLAVAS